MLKLLIQGKAEGVIIHKIDRSARNLRDWADLGELIDRGIAVLFANESLDLHTRGGRLSADIQAVVAADFIRNLREETRKGFYGRLKQGLYPLPAPLGYLDCGSGKVKEPDPATAPLVRRALELYATGRFTLETLCAELFRLGLRNKRGKRLSLNGLWRLLKNPFYMGLIRLRRTGETFSGSHKPLIAKSLFDRVQQVLSGKVNARSIRHNFLFRRLLTCIHCGYSLVGELQKGHTYYRCHTRGCTMKTIREDAVAAAIEQTFSTLQLTDTERAYLGAKVERLRERWADERDTQLSALALNLSRAHDRLRRLTDAFIDGDIDKDLFEDRKTALLTEKKDLEERRALLGDATASLPDRLAEFLELARSVYSSYKTALPDEKRELLGIVTSNRAVMGKNVELTLSQPFRLIAERASITSGSPYRDRPRTLDRLVAGLEEWFVANPTSALSTRLLAQCSTEDKTTKDGRVVA